MQATFLFWLPGDFKFHMSYLLHMIEDLVPLELLNVTIETMLRDSDTSRDNCAVSGNNVWAQEAIAVPRGVISDGNCSEIRDVKKLNEFRAHEGR